MPLEDAQVTPSRGCVFCDLNLKPTRCTDGWFHLLKEGRTIPCPVASKEQCTENEQCT
jgi:hypothetical protein